MCTCAQIAISIRCYAEASTIEELLLEFLGERRFFKVVLDKVGDLWKR